MVAVHAFGGDLVVGAEEVGWEAGWASWEDLRWNDKTRARFCWQRKIGESGPKLGDQSPSLQILDERSAELGGVS